MNRQTIGRLLPLFVRDLQAGCLTTKSMSANLTEIIGGTDADGAWTMAPSLRLDASRCDHRRSEPALCI